MFDNPSNRNAITLITGRRFLQEISFQVPKVHSWVGSWVGLFTLCLIFVTYAGGDKIPSAQAKDHIGETAVVCGRVADSRYLESGSRPTFLNFDTGVVWFATRRPVANPLAPTKCFSSSRFFPFITMRFSARAVCYSRSRSAYIQSEKLLGVAIADVADHRPDQRMIAGQAAFFHVFAEEVAEDPPEIFVARI